MTVAAPSGIPSSGALSGLAAAALFGLSAPLAKLLLPATGPLLLAGLLYLGGGLGLAAAGRVRRARQVGREARLRGSDWPYVVGIIVLGGIGGPVLMLYGLERVSGVAGSLLLNLEAPFTMVLAVLLFREHLGVRGMIASGLVVAGAVVLGYSPGELRAQWVGALAIAGACLSWAIDNNLTQRLSLRDPIAVVRTKALGAGTCTLGLALVTGERLPSMGVLVPALLVGLFCYGMSILLDMHALRILGAAREAAFFATAPFMGAAAAVPLLGERAGPAHLVSAMLMGTGIFLLVRERHEHLHAHDEQEHDHVHVHDEHHQHVHDGSELPAEPHAHPHRHAPLIHDHPHVPDVHHRHRH
jgi:drug/metabolite transporter (DMT)-like permease